MKFLDGHKIYKISIQDLNTGSYKLVDIYKDYINEDWFLEEVKNFSTLGVSKCGCSSTFEHYLQT